MSEDYCVRCGCPHTTQQPAPQPLTEAIAALESVKARHWTHWSGNDLSEFNIAIAKLRRAHGIGEQP